MNMHLAHTLLKNNVRGAALACKNYNDKKHFMIEKN